MAGPDYPVGDLPLGDVLEIVAQREAAAAECRMTHGHLARWVDAMTKPPQEGGRLDH